jgi:hypothetical protein
MWWWGRKLSSHPSSGELGGSSGDAPALRSAIWHKEGEGDDQNGPPATTFLPTPQKSGFISLNSDFCRICVRCLGGPERGHVRNEETCRDYDGLPHCAVRGGLRDRSAHVVLPSGTPGRCWRKRQRSAPPGPEARPGPLGGLVGQRPEARFGAQRARFPSVQSPSRVTGRGLREARF